MRVSCHQLSTRNHLIRVERHCSLERSRGQDRNGSTAEFRKESSELDVLHSHPPSSDRMGARTYRRCFSADLPTLLQRGSNVGTSDTDDDRVAFRDFQDPEVVLDPWTGFDLDRPDDPQRRCELAVTRRQRRLNRNSRRAGIWRTLRPCRIEQMNVSVDDRDRRVLQTGGYE